jgi:hypothetical protein
MTAICPVSQGYVEVWGQRSYLLVTCIAVNGILLLPSPLSKCNNFNRFCTTYGHINRMTDMTMTTVHTRIDIETTMISSGESGSTSPAATLSDVTEAVETRVFATEEEEEDSHFKLILASPTLQVSWDMSRVITAHENGSSVYYKGLHLSSVTVDLVDDADTANSVSTVVRDGGEFRLTDEQLAGCQTTEGVRINRSKTRTTSIQITSVPGKSDRTSPNRSARHTPVLVKDQLRGQRHHIYEADDVLSGEGPGDWIVVPSRSHSASACTRPGLRRTES